MVLLFEIKNIYFFRHLIYDKVPFIHASEIDFGIPIALWGIFVFFVLIGFKTRLFTFLNYLMSLILIGSISSYEYHVFYLYLSINFLLIFSPVSRVFSIDAILRSKSCNENNEVRQVYYLLPVFLGIALVYCNSLLYKLSSSMWLNGLGFWLPSSHPISALYEGFLYTNNEVFSKSMGYISLIFELIFPFLFFLKKFRVPLLILGVTLHVGILIIYPIPLFAYAVLSVYVLMVPIKFWKNLRLILYKKSISKKIFLLLRNSWLKHFATTKSEDYLSEKFKYIIIKSVIIFIVITQVGISYNTDLIMSFRKEMGLFNSQFDKYIMYKTASLQKWTQTFLGITNHPVFMDGPHFENYNHIIGITYLRDGKERWLPIVNEKGLPVGYNTGFNWVKWSFRVNSPTINTKELVNGIRDFTAFWAHKNTVCTYERQQFNIKIKKIDSPYGWEKNFIKKQLQKPWFDGGYVIWEKHKMESHIKEIEEI